MSMDRRYLLSEYFNTRLQRPTINRGADAPGQHFQHRLESVFGWGNVELSDDKGEEMHRECRREYLFSPSCSASGYPLPLYGTSLAPLWFHFLTTSQPTPHF